MIWLARLLNKDFHHINAACLPENIHWLISRYSWTRLIWTWLFQIPRYLELKIIFLGFTLQSFTIQQISNSSYFKLFFICPGSWKEWGSTVKPFGYTTYRPIKRSVKFWLGVAFICFVMKDFAENFQWEPVSNFWRSVGAVFVCTCKWWTELTKNMLKTILKLT